MSCEFCLHSLGFVSSLLVALCLLYQNVNCRLDVAASRHTLGLHLYLLFIAARCWYAACLSCSLLCMLLLWFCNSGVAGLFGCFVVVCLFVCRRGCCIFCLSGLLGACLTSSVRHNLATPLILIAFITCGHPLLLLLCRAVGFVVRYRFLLFACYLCHCLCA